MSRVECMCGEEPTKMNSKVDGDFRYWTCPDCNIVVRENVGSPIQVIG